MLKEMKILDDSITVLRDGQIQVREVIFITASIGVQVSYETE